MVVMSNTITPIPSVPPLPPSPSPLSPTFPSLLLWLCPPYPWLGSCPPIFHYPRCPWLRSCSQYSVAPQPIVRQLLPNVLLPPMSLVRQLPSNILLHPCPWLGNCPPIFCCSNGHGQAAGPQYPAAPHAPGQVAASRTPYLCHQSHHLKPNAGKLFGSINSSTESDIA